MADRISGRLSTLIRKGFFFAITPLFLLFTMPGRLFQSLKACGVLISGAQTDYIRFSPSRAINSLFYWTQYENFKRYGWSGRSRNIGDGDYPISRWFFMTPLSLKAYRYAPCLVPLGGMVLWLLSHLIWFADGGTADYFLPAVLAILLAGFSTLFYYNAFFFQNYNALGWIAFPLCLFFLSHGMWIGFGLCAVAVAMGSFTAIFCLSLLSGVYMLLTGAWMIIPALVPAGLVSSYGLLVLFKSGDFWQAIVSIGQGIGFIKTGKKRLKYAKPWFFMGYIAGLQILFCACHVFLHGSAPIFSLIAVFIFGLNFLVARFADTQSLFIVMMSACLADTLAEPSYLMLLPLWLALSPVPKNIGFSASPGQRFSVPDVYRPFHMRGLLDDFRAFFSDVQPGQRVMMVFDDPGTDFGKLFDGYRTLIELPSFIATEKDFHFMPDFHLVFLGEGRRHYLGQELAAVQDNIDHWKPDYVLVYSTAPGKPDPHWEAQGFTVTQTMDFTAYEDMWRDDRPYNAPTPIWWLLSVPK